MGNIELQRGRLAVCYGHAVLCPHGCLSCVCGLVSPCLALYLNRCHNIVVFRVSSSLSRLDEHQTEGHLSFTVLLSEGVNW
jgi:hypothetical protein